MPATLLLIVILWDWIPNSIDRWGRHGKVFRSGVLAILLMVTAFYLNSQEFASKTVRVGTGADAFWADHRGHEMNRALADIASVVPPGATLAVRPRRSCSTT